MLIDLFPVHDASLLVRVNQQDPVSLLCQPMGQIDGDSRLADPTFLVNQADDHKRLCSFIIFINLLA
jgi:hypothetical protein